MEVAGSILDEVSYFFVKIGLRGGVGLLIPSDASDQLMCVQHVLVYNIDSISPSFTLYLP